MTQCGTTQDMASASSSLHLSLLCLPTLLSPLCTSFISPLCTFVLLACFILPIFMFIYCLIFIPHVTQSLHLFSLYLLLNTMHFCFSHLTTMHLCFSCTIYPSSLRNPVFKDGQCLTLGNTLLGPHPPPLALTIYPSSLRTLGPHPPPSASLSTTNTWPTSPSHGSNYPSVNPQCSPHMNCLQ